MAQGRRFGRYELSEIVGQGEMLALYRARDTESDQAVILKLVHSHIQDDASLVGRFRSRAEELLHLRHPHILSVLDASFERDALYLVADVPKGDSLARRLAGRGPLEVDDALFIVSEIAEALDCAHEQRVYHHDVRPANIYLDGKTAMLADFYLLEAVGAPLTYVAPEQLDETSGEAADRRSDAYALGVVIYEMLTGRPPFEGTAADVAAAHLTQRPLPPRLHNPDLLPALDAILLKALAKQPASRYQSAGDLAAAMHEAVQAAETRRMAGVGGASDRSRAASDTVYRPASTHSEQGVPTWVWIGLGILLVVVLSIFILLVTG